MLHNFIAFTKLTRQVSSLTYDYLQQISHFRYTVRTGTGRYICSDSFTSDQGVPSFRTVSKIAKSDH